MSNEAINLNGEYKSLGLWNKTFESKDGAKDVISGKIVIREDMVGEFYINIYKNDNKKSESSPDYNFYLKPVTGNRTVASMSDII